MGLCRDRCISKERKNQVNNAAGTAAPVLGREIIGLKYVDALCVDTNGSLRGKRLPVSDLAKLEKGQLNIPQAIFSLSVRGDTLDGGGRGISDGDPDGYCYPVHSTFAPLPWTSEPSAQVLLAMRDAKGQPVDIDPRRLLNDMVEKIHALGYQPVVAFELEFYLLRAPQAPSHRPEPVMLANAAGGVCSQNYGVDILDAQQPFLETVSRYAAELGLPAGAISAESGIGQFEINLGHVADPALAADHAVLLKQVVKKAAEAHGLSATFMAKPFGDQPGNGMHVHMSLLDRDQQNAFAPGHAKNRLAHAIAGLQALMPGTLAFFAPNINAFRRFQPGSFAPVNRSWGLDNRSVALRIPTGNANATRIEHRVAGADANPLLVMASILAGVLHGLENDLVPSEAATGNNNTVHDPAFPASFLDALDATQGDEVLAGLFGRCYLNFYVDLKRKELAGFLGEYSEKEYQWFL